MKRKTYLFLAIAVIGLISVSTIAAIAPASTADDANISSSSVNLQVGDLICQYGKKDDGFDYIPGRFNHIQIYVGNGWVVEANPGDGVHYSQVSTGEVYRVSTSWSVKQAAADWAESKVGLNYDYWLFGKQVDGNSYYCSELTWAAYLSTGGPDIDQNPGWTWSYSGGVAPTECADDGDTYFVGTL